jgi:hypothetical protein
MKAEIKKKRNGINPFREGLTIVDCHLTQFMLDE